ncbi:uncharacterized protein OCT59_003036 [Rhizophagus irregularis]|uniref:uncharacterized protein n=1 Tax=Rhizophagus irregularis TaxID=588596 RepID=UPI003321CC92|nr:hypothetical protein OCT59_003036 [Rhizophagus irregularis]
MGDLYQNLTELRRCFDGGLISDSEYQSLRTLAMNSWTSANLPPQRQPESVFNIRLKIYCLTLSFVGIFAVNL